MKGNARGEDRREGQEEKEEGGGGREAEEEAMKESELQHSFL